MPPPTRRSTSQATSSNPRGPRQCRRCSGSVLPDVLEAFSHTVSAAIWFGLTTGYLILTGSYRIPRKFLTCYPD